MEQVNNLLVLKDYNEYQAAKKSPGLKRSNAKIWKFGRPLPLTTLLSQFPAVPEGLKEPKDPKLSG
ncbi:hypothetical protein J3Q64DRAFT_1835894 [Phycomyces blakesleeanus]|uniref:Uncharacterized protein n=2 Tax=Phycomyces blakesleeanus TaxID=4837 RepID=A0A162X4D3_PHYB8|nr:hypothetical protein PHYBLDRAFT_146657 [Phycomyces blakesleeanus NRRL 1555(-)]OAD72465.1 hypothetical protein PHYBLDRAFT_146657 [Phycomyces blakesleeanus NRRL 1555(-)]|eukprot:XP_018290505.1 hypothetical protein PHYBLDRAFT_146657 [Phycomyces blakesleeanus NRRL 1555(-)]